MSAPTPSPLVARLRRFVHLWDEAVRVPGTRFTVGLDALLGLVPGLGDVLGGVAAAAVLVASLRAGVPPAVALRMLLNILVDVVVGAVPLVGDVFDAGFRANRRNVTLLERWLAAPVHTHRVSRVALLAVAAGGLALFAAALYGAMWVARAALRLIVP